jgi:hypothetical protein
MYINQDIQLNHESVIDQFCQKLADCVLFNKLYQL